MQRQTPNRSLLAQKIFARHGRQAELAGYAGQRAGFQLRVIGQL
jgi:hypothetical protein